MVNAWVNVCVKKEEKGGKGEYWECTHTTDIRRYCSSNMHVMYTYVYIEYIYHLS